MEFEKSRLIIFTTLIVLLFGIQAKLIGALMLNKFELDLILEPVAMDMATPSPEIMVSSTFCFGAPVFLSTSANYVSYQWSNGSQEETVILYEEGNFQVTVMDVNGCTGSTNVDIVYKPALEVTVFGQDEICDNDFTVLYVDDIFEVYEWSNGLLSDQIPVTEAGIYTITVVDANGCTASDSFEVTIKEIKKPKIIGGNKICLGGDLNLSIENTYQNIEWYNGEGSDEIVVDRTGNVFVIVTDFNGCTAHSSIYVSQYDFTETFSFEITCDPELVTVVVEDFIDDNGCNAINLHHVVIDTMDRCRLEYEIELSNERCLNGMNGSIEIVVNEAYLELQYELLDSFGNSLISNSLNDLSEIIFVDNLPSGEYSIQFTNEFGLFVEEVLKIEREKALIYNFEESHSLQIGQSVNLEFDLDLAQLDSINWFVDDGVLVCQNCNNFTAMPEDSTIYNAEITDLFGCVYREDIVVNITSNKNVYIPNVFNPKSIGGNEIFKPFGPGIKRTTQFLVYDRWGNLVHNEKGEIEGWNGKVNKRKVQAGVYLYLMEIEFFDGIRQIYKGQLNVVL